MSRKVWRDTLSCVLLLSIVAAATTRNGPHVVFWSNCKIRRRDIRRTTLSCVALGVVSSSLSRGAIIARCHARLSHILAFDTGIRADGARRPVFRVNKTRIFLPSATTTDPSMSQAGTVLTHRSRVTRSSAFPRHCATDVLRLGLRPPTVFKPAARFPVRQTRYTRLGSSFRSPSIIIIIITRSRRRYAKRRNNGYDDDTPVVYSNHEFGKLQRIIALLLSDVAASCFCSTTYT